MNDTSDRADTTSDGNRRERVVILGSGWAGYAFARTLDPARYERIVISPRSYFVFTPLLASTSVGTLEFRAVLEPVRRLGVDRFHQGWADGIDFARRTVRVEANTADEPASSTAGTLQLQSSTRGGAAAVTDAAAGGAATGVAPAQMTKKGEMFDVAYDKLVVAVGAYSQTFGIEGVREHANFLRDVGDARRIRLRVLQLFEKASAPSTTDAQRRKLLHFAVVGGGPTGFEFAAELHDLVHDDLRRLYPDLNRFVRITVYDIAPTVLPMFDRQLSHYAVDLFARQGIEVRTEHHLERIRPDDDGSGGLLLKIREHGEQEIGAGIVVWSTGLMQNPLVEKLISTPIASGEPASAKSDAAAGRSDEPETVHILKDAKTGGMVTDPYLRVRLSSPQDLGSNSSSSTPTTPAAVLPDVYAIGDCSVLEGTPLPATAQVASQQAVYLAKQLNRRPRNGSAAAAPPTQQKPFKFRNWGTMAYLGSWRAIHQSGTDELKGRAAWILWRTAYLTYSMSIRNKIMVPVYWLMTWIFGRDISRF